MILFIQIIGLGIIFSIIVWGVFFFATSFLLLENPSVVWTYIYNLIFNPHSTTNVPSMWVAEGHVAIAAAAMICLMPPNTTSSTNSALQSLSKDLQTGSRVNRSEWL